jgi:hypothetical protein
VLERVRLGERWTDYLHADFDPERTELLPHRSIVGQLGEALEERLESRWRHDGQETRGRIAHVLSPGVLRWGDIDEAAVDRSTWTPRERVATP